MWDVNEGGMESFDASDSRENTIAILEMDSGHRRRKRVGIRYVEGSYVVCGRNVISTS